MPDRPTAPEDGEDKEVAARAAFVAFALETIGNAEAAAEELSLVVKRAREHLAGLQATWASDDTL